MIHKSFSSATDSSLGIQTCASLCFCVDVTEVNIKLFFLQYMATLKKMQAEKDSGEWESLGDQAQQQVCVTFILSCQV